MNNLRLGIVMIDEPFYSKSFISELLENFEIKFVLLHTEFISIERILKTFLIYSPIKFLKTVFGVFKNTIKGGEIKNILTNNQVPILKTDNVNSEEVSKFIKYKEIDILISFNCPQKIKKELLDKPKIYPINIHLGYLPQYRGIFPIFHAFNNGENFAGITIHIMNEEFDDGDIINQIKISIEKKDDLLSLYDKAFSEIPKLTLQTIHDINSGNVVFKRNNSEDASYFSYPSFREIISYRKLLKHKKRL